MKLRYPNMPLFQILRYIFLDQDGANSKKSIGLLINDQDVMYMCAKPMVQPQEVGSREI